MEGLGRVVLYKLSLGRIIFRRVVVKPSEITAGHISATSLPIRRFTIPQQHNASFADRHSSSRLPHKQAATYRMSRQTVIVAVPRSSVTEVEDRINWSIWCSDHCSSVALSPLFTVAGVNREALSVR